MDSPHDRQADYDASSMPREAHLRALMEPSDRDVAVGRTAPLADVLAEPQPVANQIEILCVRKA